MPGDNLMPAPGVVHHPADVRSAFVWFVQILATLLSFALALSPL